MNDNEQQEGRNINIPDNNAQNQEQIQQDSFFNRISSKEVLQITSDFFPSLILVCLILQALYITPNFCDRGFSSILRAMVMIYTAFVVKAFMQTLMICASSQNTDFSKASLTTMELILSTCYYIAVISAYFIYRGRPEDCFMTNTYATILLFVLVLIGIISICRHALNLFMIILCFPVMVYYFLKNPQSFYSNFGIDPEIVKNLPTIKADSTHVSMCPICNEDVEEGQEILILRCQGKHFFHEQCIKTWLIRKVNCPICRQENVL